MTLGGVIFMATSWVLVLTLVVYCFRKVLTNR
jgi:hypothetical protein